VSVAQPTDQQLLESEDIGYQEPPKSIALYVEATKWIVGLATGSFLLTGTILANRPEGALGLLIPVGLAIFSMSAAAACGVRALQCYTRLANLFEVHAAKRPFEVDVRSNGYQDVRWVTVDRIQRCAAIRHWLESANGAYEAMTRSFALGIACYLAFGAIYLSHTPKSARVTFSVISDPSSAALGVVHDPSSHADCLVIRTGHSVSCVALPTKAAK
jgi:hypothetical protein